MKVLIAGLGSIGRRHLRNLRKVGIQDVIAYRVRGNDIPEMDEHPLPVYGSLTTALAQKPDIVFVTNPTSLHLEVALAAARQGCHLFIEKPLSHTLKSVDELIDITTTNGSVAMVGCNFRFHPALQQIQRLLVAGSLGRVITARGHAGEFLPGWHPGEDWRLGYSARKELGGGVILTLIHELDYAYWLFGPVRKVFAQAGGWGGLDLNVEDTAEILLEHRSQSRVSIHLNYVQRPPTRTLEIIAERGTIQWDYQAGMVKWYDSETAHWEIWTEPPTFDRNTMFFDEVTHFIDCVTGRSAPLIPLTEAKAVLEIALAAKQSAEDDCSVTLKDS